MAKEEVKTTPDEKTDAKVLADAPDKNGEAATEQTAEATKSAPKRRKAKRTVTTGQMHVLATFNNTIVSFTDSKGAVLSTSSAGSNGFRGSKKGTAYAAQVAAERAGQTAKQQYGLNKVDVFVKGIGLGREAAVRSLSGLDIAVEGIRDVTGIPHGGVRPRKARRV